MAKLYLQYDELRHGFVENIDISIRRLENIINKLKDLSIPITYSRRQEILNIIESYERNLNSLKYIRNSVKNTNSLIDKHIDEEKLRISKFSTNLMPNRKGVE
ncbi:MAG: hypothetical protein ACLUD7_02945 [Lachnospiraceae bacterium]